MLVLSFQVDLVKWAAVVGCPGDPACIKILDPASSVVTAFRFTTTEDLPHTLGLRTFRHNGITKNKSPYFNDLEHKIIYNELRAKYGDI